MNRQDAILQGAAVWVGYYRENIDEFVRDYLHIDLQDFQKVALVEMNECTQFVFIASRGCGKTFLSALFCCARCILYPGTQIAICSSTRTQGMLTFRKIELELTQASRELHLEIDWKKTKWNGADAKIVFKNGSYIVVVTASDSARGNRANIVLIDEFRMVKKHIVDTVMKKFLTQQRMPDYSSLTNAERIRAWNEEENMMMFLSSAYYVNNWSYVKCQDTFRAMLNPRNKQFICGIPYQCPLECGLLRRSTIEDELLESEFNEITFSMEYEARWYGSSAGSFFDFDSVAKNRKISYPMYPNDTLPQSMRSDPKLKIPKKLPGEKRLLSVDVALMQSTKNDNDAAAIFINQLLPTKAGRYINNIVYPTADEGLRTQEQALRIRRAYEEFECDYIVLDCQGKLLPMYTVTYALKRTRNRGG